MKAKNDNVVANFRNDLYDKVNFSYLQKTDNGWRQKPVSAISIRVFMAIVYKVFNKGSNTVYFSTQELKRLTGNNYPNNKRFRASMETARDEIGSLYIDSITEKSSRRDYLFQTIEISENGVICRVNEDYQYLFNNLFTGNYSKIMLAMLNNMSRYEQLLALRLVEYRDCCGVNNEKTWHTTIDDFRRWMNVPDSYDFREIKRTVIEPAIKKLQKYFIGLHYEVDRVDGKVKTLHFIYDCLEENVPQIKSNFDEAKQLEEWHGQF